MAQVRVPERHGDSITVTPGGTGEPRIYAIKDGLVEVAEEHLREFLALFEGSELADAGPTTQSSSATPPAAPAPVGGSSQSAETPPKKEA